MAKPKITAELLRELPKTDLHVHLDGSLRPSTLRQEQSSAFVSRLIASSKI